MARLITTTAGRGFAAIFAALKVFRRRRPIHPQGVSLIGSVERFGGTDSGISWIDTPGTAELHARLSRSVGLPKSWPDIIGLALRIADSAGSFDILLASTGMSKAGRFVLLPHKRASAARLTSMMPYRGTKGPLLLAARTIEPGGALPSAPEAFRSTLENDTWRLALYHAHPTGSWVRFGTLSLKLDAERKDTDLRFDPVLNPLPGAGTYEWTSKLRVPSYKTARGSDG